jgi:hypothetical protein
MSMLRQIAIYYAARTRHGVRQLIVEMDAVDVRVRSLTSGGESESTAWERVAEELLKGRLASATPIEAKSKVRMRANGEVKS